MNLKKSIELTRLSLRADFESHKFNSVRGTHDQGILLFDLGEIHGHKTNNNQECLNNQSALETLDES
jgi:hypothetical protein